VSKLDPGVWGVLPTPFYGDQLEVDRESLRRAVELYMSIGAAGIVALGVFGEAARLTPDERALVIREVAGAAPSCGIVVGLTSLDTREACLEARQAVQAAPRVLTAVMVQVNSTSSEDLCRHLQAIHDASGLPIVLQDYPVASGVRVDVSVLAVAAGLACVAAVKCESPPTSATIAELALLTDVPLFGGLGGVGLLDELMAGAAGSMTGFSYPEALQALVSAWLSEGYEGARRAILPWLPLINFEAQIDVGLAIRKENLRRRGILNTSIVRPPARPLPDCLLDLVAAHQRAIAGLVV
jgi:4-hydroxy-tetrahydrodipicolinate synthase